MKEPKARGPGRPVIFDKGLERIQVLVTKDQHAAAKAEAKRSSVSISEVYRGWIDKGRGQKR